MEKVVNIPELLAPAGDFECLKTAILYGADAVYFASKQFGLRAFAGNFNNDEIIKAVEFAHNLNRKTYITLNIFARNQDISNISEYLKFLQDAKVDAVIVSDPGFISVIKESVPEMEIHLSTQANTTNWKSAKFWHDMGVDRIVLSRELSLQEIREIRELAPSSLKLECFVHGAMCVAYSGRCALSNYLTGRDSNKGECAQPCRWKYYLSEETRPGEYMPVVEDDKGTYILNSKDLCMIGHISDLIEAGIDSFKVEGRMKGIYYVATVVKAYKRELDLFRISPKEYKFNNNSIIELKKTSHRKFTTGFFYGRPDAEDHVYESSKYVREYEFVGIITGYDNEKKVLQVEQRNNFKVGDILEVMCPGLGDLELRVGQLFDEALNPISVAPHPQQKVYIPFQYELPYFSFLRRKTL